MQPNWIQGVWDKTPCWIKLGLIRKGGGIYLPSLPGLMTNDFNKMVKITSGAEGYLSISYVKTKNYLCFEGEMV